MPDQAPSKGGGGGGGQAKMRAKNANGSATTGRPRPKTIHVDSGADPSRALLASRGKQGSGTNLAGMHIIYSNAEIQSHIYFIALMFINIIFFSFLGPCFFYVGLTLPLLCRYVAVVSFLLLSFLATESKPEARGAARGSNPSLNRRGSNSSLHTATGKKTAAAAGFGFF